MSPRVLKELLWGGQTFQWFPLAMENGSADESVWEGLLDDCLLRLKSDDSGKIHFQCHSGGGAIDRAVELLECWFRIDEDLNAMIATFPLEKDPYLTTCIQAFPGLRILRQPIEEVLLTFLCSSNKRIDQIRQMLNRICRRFGDPVSEGYHRYPKWGQLAGADLDELLECRTGYRGKYILGTASILAEYPQFFRNFGKLPYAEARLRLQQFPGVGPKVADCILLYGASYYEAFPLDTWMLKAMRHRYGMADATPAEMLSFATTYFGSFAGIAQQYIFAWERDRAEL